MPGTSVAAYATRRRSSSTSRMRSWTTMPLANVAVRTSPSSVDAASTGLNSAWAFAVSRKAAHARSAETSTVICLWIDATDHTPDLGIQSRISPDALLLGRLSFPHPLGNPALEVAHVAVAQ